MEIKTNIESKCEIAGANYFCVRICRVIKLNVLVKQILWIIYIDAINIKILNEY